MNPARDKARRSRSWLWNCLALICLLPALLFIYLGQFSRLMVDDFCIVKHGLALGPWQSIFFYYDKWTAAYSSSFVKTSLAPLEASLPRIMPALIIALWIAGSYLLLRQLQAWFPLRGPGRALALALAAGAVAAGINGFYTPQPLYWMSANVQYSLPLALLSWYFCLALWLMRSRGQTPRWKLALAASMLISFLCAGFAELQAAFQASFFTLLLPLIVALLPAGRRRRAGIVLGAGWLATLLSLLVQLLSPGVAFRAQGYGSWIQEPLSQAGLLIARTAQQVVPLLTDKEVFAGFFLLLALAFLAALAWRKPPAPTHGSRPIQLKSAPLLLGLALQLMALPLLWQHQSDQPLFLNRFSLGYMSVIALNLAFILGFLGLLWRRGRINQMMKRRETRPVNWIAASLAVIALLFALTQIRSIHARALIYLVYSCHAALGILAWQLSPLLPSGLAQRFRTIVAGAYGMVFLSIFALLAVSVSRHGEPVLRTLSFAPGIISLLGAMWGIFLGLALSSLAGARLRWLKMAAATIVLIICIGMTLGHAALLPQLRDYAAGWDARHQYILERREAGESEITVEPLAFSLAKHLRVSRIHMHRCPWFYYEVDQIYEAS